MNLVIILLNPSPNTPLDKITDAIDAILVGDFNFPQILKLSNGSLNDISTGHVITMVSTDAHKLQEVSIAVFIYFNFLKPTH